ncbi:MAG: hypothetical protein ACLP9L_34775 [Thermoguttaceae bacterium]
MRSNLCTLFAVVLFFSVSWARAQGIGAVNPRLGRPGLHPVNDGLGGDAFPGVPRGPVFAFPGVPGVGNQERRRDERAGFPDFLHAFSHVHLPSDDSSTSPGRDFRTSPVDPPHVSGSVSEFNDPAAGISRVVGERFGRASVPASEFDGPATGISRALGENFGHASIPVSEFDDPATGISRVVGEGLSHASISVSEFDGPASGIARAVGGGLSHGEGGILAAIDKVFAGIGAALAALFKSL